jgi:aromatic ring-opening dioxygenase catalytic subunit (LigB family)
MTSVRLPSYYLSHGGGPWPYMKNEFGGQFSRLEASIKDIPRQLGVKPRAVLVISGHWEAMSFTVSAHPQPPMIYDYDGFPEHTYHVHYRAPGSPEHAKQVQALLCGGGLAAHLDGERGFDHGTFSVLEPLFPAADIPVVQLSLQANMDPAIHLKAGQLLAPLREEGVLIIGSGMSYHNLQRLDSRGEGPSQQFDAWLLDTLVKSPTVARWDRLIHWTQAPAARLAHAREDHLLPLMVAVGAAQEEPATCVYHQRDLFGSITCSSYRFGVAQ